MMKQRHEDSGFASKRLAEVSKGFQKDLLLKDASALFSSSFEKDAHEVSWYPHAKSYSERLLVTYSTLWAKV